MDKFVQVIDDGLFGREIQHNLDTKDISVTVYCWDNEYNNWTSNSNIDYTIVIIDSNRINLSLNYNNNKFKIVIFG